MIEVCIILRIRLLSFTIQALGQRLCSRQTPREVLKQVLLQCREGARDWIPFTVFLDRGHLSASAALRRACCGRRYAAKMEHEGAAMYDAAVALRDAMIALGLACDGGKDSLSMAAAAGGEVRCPRPCCIFTMACAALF